MSTWATVDGVRFLTNANGDVVGYVNGNGQERGLYWSPTPNRNAGDASQLRNVRERWPIYFAHRGSASICPENTIEAFDYTLAAGATEWLEFDVQTLSDGALGVMHDSTVDRTTTGTGAVNTFNTAAFTALNIDADTVTGALQFGNTLHPPMLADVLTRYAGRAKFIPEDKDGLSIDAMMAAFTAAGISKRDVIFTSFFAASVTKAANAGWQALWACAPTTPPATVVATGAQWVATDYSTTSEAQIKGFKDAGLKVVLFTINRRADRDTFARYGADAIFTDDPEYLVGGSARIRTADDFKKLTWSPGMLANNNGADTTNRFKFEAPGFLVQANNAAGASFRAVVLGGMGPIKGLRRPLYVTLRFKVTYVTAFAADRWFGLALGDSDAGYFDAATPAGQPSTISFLCRKNGTMNIYKRPTGTAGALLATLATPPAIADGEEVSFSAVITPTTLTLNRLDGSGAVTHTVSVADAEVRGNYIHVMSSGLNLKLRDLSVE